MRFGFPELVFVACMKWFDLRLLSCAYQLEADSLAYLDLLPEYDIASLYMASFYCFVTKAYARRPGAAASALHCVQGRQAS